MSDLRVFVAEYMHGKTAGIEGAMTQLYVAIALALALNGCAVAALPVIEQIPIWGGAVVAGAAAGNLTVNAVHDCKADGGCTEIPLPP